MTSYCRGQTDCRKEDFIMTNKEVEMVVAGVVEEHNKEKTPFDRDSFVALVKMMQALYSRTTPEHQIDTVSRMKVLLNSVDGLHTPWKPEELFDACIADLEKRPESFSMSLDEANIFIRGVDMALKRLNAKAEACPTLAALAETFH